MVRVSTSKSYQKNRTTARPTASKRKQVKKWITLRVSLCSECGLHCLGTAFVHASDPETGEIGEDEIGDYYCMHVGCPCRGKFMGHYTRYCSKCKKTEEVPDEEIDDI